MRLQSQEDIEFLERSTKLEAATKEMVEAYREMEKGIDDEILCHYNGMRLHNAMEDLRALVIPGYEPKYQPNEDDDPIRLIENGEVTPEGEAFFNRIK